MIINLNCYQMMLIFEALTWLFSLSQRFPTFAVLQNYLLWSSYMHWVIKVIEFNHWHFHNYPRPPHQSPRLNNGQRVLESRQIVLHSMTYICRLLSRPKLPGSCWESAQLDVRRGRSIHLRKRGRVEPFNPRTQTRQVIERLPSQTERFGFNRLFQGWISTHPRLTRFNTQKDLLFYKSVKI